MIYYIQLGSLLYLVRNKISEAQSVYINQAEALDLISDPDKADDKADIIFGDGRKVSEVDP